MPNRTEPLKPLSRGFDFQPQQDLVLQFLSFGQGFLPASSLLQLSALIDGATSSSSCFSYEGSGSSSSLKKILEQSSRTEPFKLLRRGLDFQPQQDLALQFLSLGQGFLIAAPLLYLSALIDGATSSSSRVSYEDPGSWDVLDEIFALWIILVILRVIMGESYSCLHGRWR